MQYVNDYIERLANFLQREYRFHPRYKYQVAREVFMDEDTNDIEDIYVDNKKRPYIIRKSLKFTRDDENTPF